MKPGRRRVPSVFTVDGHPYAARMRTGVDPISNPLDPALRTALNAFDITFDGRLSAARQ
ncbi:hypothetical protein Shyd_79650 [Streptomyces hydrogenans]|mgnify:CR=1 FL=1|uniref:Uncharacterized protein n=1 Tax=Streptomyces hydrogenans TaxID=1873719 RepID=A0ABQ3PNJ3_9ACTN|nr:hypothetical protein GCM10018784_52990 [Streptomyces hydrogenans]GHI26594.1 hypothetical protein Shyd_79650 [Streptomyces hydrogenans]